MILSALLALTLSGARAAALKALSLRYGSPIPHGLDIVALQDVRGIPHQPDLAFAARDLNPAPPNDGLEILSRFPILKTRRAAFRSGGGALMARVEIPGGALDVYDADLGEDGGARLFELFDMVRAESAGRPFLLLGDLGPGPVSGLFGALSSVTVMSKTLPQSQALRRLRAEFLEAADDVLLRNRSLRWIPLFGFIEGLRADEEFSTCEFLAQRAESILISDYKDCAAP